MTNPALFASGVFFWIFFGFFFSQWIDSTYLIPTRVNRKRNRPFITKVRNLEKTMNLSCFRDRYIFSHKIREFHTKGLPSVFSTKTFSFEPLSNHLS